MAAIGRGQPLLRVGAAEAIRAAYSTYPECYDEVLDDVRARLSTAGFATKLDLAALIAWKHVRNAPWMRALLCTPADTVESATGAAFVPGLTDSERVAALRTLSGFGSGGAFTSVLLTAWDPTRFGVYDRLVHAKRSVVVNDGCGCDWSNLPIYWEHLRAIAGELTSRDESVPWTPRMIEMGIMNLPGSV